MLSQNQQKRIRLLHQKKQREQNRLFILEGNTIISDLLVTSEINSENLELLVATPEWMAQAALSDTRLSDRTVTADPAALKKLSALVTPPEVLAVMRMPAVSHEESFRPEQLREGVTLAFESIRDPGNLGTIIRTADWFGIRNIICSPDSVDVYNQKVVQASMGAVMRTVPAYLPLDALFVQAGRFKIPVIGTAMDGEDLFDTPIKVPGIVVFGNESHGISTQLEPFFRHKVRIPDFPAGSSGTESLNVATSVAIVCAEIRRRQR